MLHYQSSVWSCFISQVTGPSFAKDGLKDPTSLDHCICLLYLVLSPPKGRDVFLTELKSTEAMQLEENKAGWTVVSQVKLKYLCYLFKQKETYVRLIA